jgi:hypothetical protein
VKNENNRDETADSGPRAVRTSTKDGKQRLKIAYTGLEHHIAKRWWPWLRRGLKVLGYRHIGSGVHAVDGPGNEYVMYFVRESER